MNVASKTPTPGQETREAAWASIDESCTDGLAEEAAKLAPQAGSEGLLRSLPQASQEQLLRLRDAYLTGLWQRSPALARIDLLFELEREARRVNLAPGQGVNLALSRISMASKALRAKLRQKGDLARMWSAYEALIELVRGDCAAADAKQRDNEFDEFAREIAENVQATSAALFELAQAATPGDAAERVLDAVRASFGWVYGSYWTLEDESKGLTFSLMSGEPSATIRQAHLLAKHEAGTGSIGKAWHRGDVSVAQLTPEAKLDAFHTLLFEHGTRTVICLPVMIAQRVIGVMAFMATQVLDVSEARRDVLRNVAILMSSSLERMAQVKDMRDLASSSQAVNLVLRSINEAGSAAEAGRGALDAMRTAFEWDHGIYWARSSSDQSMRLAAESGQAGEIFRRVSHASAPVIGVGVCGLAWQRRELVVVDELGSFAGESRAAAARDSGLVSGVCLPLIVRDDVVGFIELWSKHRVQLSAARIDALRSVGSAVSASLERLNERDG
ncbi:MAG TPA: GAF domain-containing protein, partial [Polyangiales bacterium]